MDEIAAQKLIRETLEAPFDKDRFVYLVKNILNHVDDAPFTYQGKYIFDGFADAIKLLERVGKYSDPSDSDKRIDILIVHLKRATSLERARTMQRNFVAKYLNGSRGELKDAALVAFVAPNPEDWRFSFVKMEYGFDETGKIKEELTPARRCSFLVGTNEHSHTAQTCLLPVLRDDEADPTLKDLEDIFSVERVTKEFFEKYRDLFLDLKDALDAIVKRDAEVKADFEAKGVTTIDFAKKLLGQIVFLYFLQKKGWFGVARGEAWGDGSKHFLRELFENEHGDYENFFNDILEPLFYEALRLERPGDYYSRFDCRIPFLNGGLFDPLRDYDWVNTDILIPNELFSNAHKTKEGDSGTGVLDVFDRYNFTVKEDEPLEKEVAVDPEMLGKVFENLLEIKDRKSKGTYYTPREIVHYMCRESLTHYLAAELDGRVKKDDIETLIKYGEAVVENDSRVIDKGRETQRYAFRLPQGVRDHAALIDAKLAALRVCDPAVGSGAFVVGMMNEVVRTRNALATYLDDAQERTPYHLKRHAIQNCLYGVDIEPSAVEIAKLRLWLSLIVDEEKREAIQPLPNLDYKIVQGNALLGVEKDLFNNRLVRELERLKPLYFNENSVSKKENYKNQIDDLIGQITKGRTEFDFEVYFSEVFRKKKGFDVVIANPPYVVSKDKKLRELYREGVYGRANLYGLFIQRGLQLIDESGQISFINPKTLLTDKYFINLRKVIKQQAELKGVVLIADRHNTFESVLQECIILNLERKANVSKTYLVNTRTISTPDDLSDPLHSVSITSDRVLLDDTYDGAFYIGVSEFDYQVFDRMNATGVKLATLGLKAETGKIQFDKYRKYARSNNANNACRLIWAENIQRYAHRKSRKRIGKEWLAKRIIPLVPPNITGIGIVTQRISANEQPRRIIATVIDPKTVSTNNIYSENHTNFIPLNVSSNYTFLLGVLNSSLIEFIFRRLNSNTQVSAGDLNSLPFPPIPDKKTLNDIETQVSELLELGGVDCPLNDIGQAIDYEHRLDVLIGSLYGFSSSEVKWVQEQLPSYETVYGK